MSIEWAYRLTLSSYFTFQKTPVVNTDAYLFSLVFFILSLKVTWSINNPSSPALVWDPFSSAITVFLFKWFFHCTHSPTTAIVTWITLLYVPINFVNFRLEKVRRERESFLKETQSLVLSLWSVPGFAYYYS